MIIIEKNPKKYRDIIFWSILHIPSSNVHLVTSINPCPLVVGKSGTCFCVSETKREAWEACGTRHKFSIRVWLSCAPVTSRWEVIHNHASQDFRKIPPVLSRLPAYTTAEGLWCGSAAEGRGLRRPARKLTCLHRHRCPHKHTRMWSREAWQGRP